MYDQNMQSLFTSSPLHDRLIRVKPSRLGRAGRSAYVIAMLLAFIVLTSCSSAPAVNSSPTKETATIDANKGPTPVPTLLASSPTNCQWVPPPDSKVLSGDWGNFHGGGKTRLVGQDPVWIFDFANVLNNSSERVLHVNSQGYTPWPGTKILWEVGTNSAATYVVTVQVINQRTGKLAWWNPDRQPMQTLTLTKDLQTYHGSVEPQGWQEWGSILHISEAGCYTMNVTWPSGHWSMSFAAGR